MSSMKCDYQTYQGDHEALGHFQKVTTKDGVLSFHWSFQLSTLQSSSLIINISSTNSWHHSHHHQQTTQWHRGEEAQITRFRFRHPSQSSTVYPAAMYMLWGLCTLHLLARQVSYCRQFGFLFLCLCEIFWVLINSLYMWLVRGSLIITEIHTDKPTSWNSQQQTDIHQPAYTQSYR